MLWSGLLNWSWWSLLLTGFALTHITIAAVTIFLHPHQAHHALNLHPAISHFFRFWVWLTTGMVTREWVAVHRKHHAKCETPDDPHSPQFYGIGRLLTRGVLLYVREANDPETIERYGHGTPQDWMEKHLYTRYPLVGILTLGVVDVILFGFLPGGLLYGLQMAWIPFWAAGVVNGLGHYWGYRNYPVENASRNIVPWGILIGGEELHNNHHAAPSSAKLSARWYECDIGWMYIRLLAALKLAHVRKMAPVPRLNPAKKECDAETIQAVIDHRYYVLAKYASSVNSTWRERLANLKLGAATSLEAFDLCAARALLRRFELSSFAPSGRSLMLTSIVRKDAVLNTLYSMREDLSALWARSSASSEELLQELRDWCRRAETSGIAALEEFSRTLPQLV